MKIDTQGLDPVKVAKRAFYIAYQACSDPQGLGLLQARVGAEEDDVWRNVIGAGDYPDGADLAGFRPDPSRAVFGDYVMGRMMKLRISFTGNGVEVDDVAPRLDYQGWCAAFPTYRDLIDAAIESLGEKSELTQ